MKVLLLEAGVDEPFLSDVPINFEFLQQTNIDWKFQTEPSPNYCKAMNEGRCNWPRGKSLGGTSVINAMMHVRGNKADYDEWAVLNPGWSFNDCLPYFKKLVKLKISGMSTANRGTNGTIDVEYNRNYTAVANLVLQAAAELNQMNPGDYNSPVDGQVGYSKIQSSLRDGLRCSTAKAYLRPTRSRKNINITMAAVVQKIIINPTTKTATGVTYIKNGVTYTATATKEVIISAGAIQSPQLLKLSGVGPAAELAKFSIPVMKNALGVGENLQDHISMGGLNYEITNGTQWYTVNLTNTMTLAAGYDFIFNYNGSTYSNPFSEVLAFINSKYQNPALKRPDLQIFSAGSSYSGDGGVWATKSLGFTISYYNTLFKPYENSDVFSIFPVLLRPKSRGRILLNGTSVNMKPLIYPNYFDKIDDINSLVILKYL